MNFAGLFRPVPGLCGAAGSRGVQPVIAAAAKGLQADHAINAALPEADPSPAQNASIFNSRDRFLQVGGDSEAVSDVNPGSLPVFPHPLFKPGCT